MAASTQARPPNTGEHYDLPEATMKRLPTTLLPLLLLLGACTQSATVTPELEARYGEKGLLRASGEAEFQEGQRYQTGDAEDRAAVGFQ